MTAQRLPVSHEEPARPGASVVRAVPRDTPVVITRTEAAWHPSHAVREVTIEPTFAGWREAARLMLREELAPDALSWRSSTDAQTSLLALAADRDAVAGVRGNDEEGATDRAGRRVPKAFVRVAAAVSCHRDPGRWDLMYRVLWRLTHGEPALMEVATDPDVHRLVAMERAVRRAVHKMHAFVRFRAVDTVEGDTTTTTYVAWFEPAHPVVERAATLFARRFASMRWSILTPERCAHWDGTELRFTPGVPRDSAPTGDALESLWRSYYAHIFNPARLSLSAMRAEMPKGYWRNLPEAALIPTLSREAPARVARMLLQVRGTPEPLPAELTAPVGRTPRGRPGRPSRAVQPTYQAAPADVSPDGSWDPVHDPGVVAARERALDVRLHAPDGLNLQGVPVRVGTASWTDPTLLQRGVFYPDDVTSPDARLRYYADHYSLVEVDSSYYAMPSRAMAAAWAARSPDGFVFDIKAFALMTTHGAETKRLPEWLRRALPRTVAGNARVYARDLPTALVDETWARFLSALAPLREAGKLGPVLLQYPRWFTPTRANADELVAARERLGDHAAAIEFRNPAWVEGRMADRTFALLERLGLAYVVVDAPPGTASSMPPVVALTTPELAVVRLHGRRSAAWEAKHTIVSERYRYLYDREELRGWAERITELADRIRQRQPGLPDMAHATQGVHVVHNNCHANYGTTNADEITELLIEFDQERLAGWD